MSKKRHYLRSTPAYVEMAALVLSFISICFGFVGLHEDWSWDLTVDTEYWIHTVKEVKFDNLVIRKRFPFIDFNQFKPEDYYRIGVEEFFIVTFSNFVFMFGVLHLLTVQKIDDMTFRFRTILNGVWLLSLPIFCLICIPLHIARIYRSFRKNGKLWQAQYLAKNPSLELFAACVGYLFWFDGTVNNTYLPLITFNVAHFQDFSEKNYTTYDDRKFVDSGEYEMIVNHLKALGICEPNGIRLTCIALECVSTLFFIISFMFYLRKAVSHWRAMKHQEVHIFSYGKKQLLLMLRLRKRMLLDLTKEQRNIAKSHPNLTKAQVEMVFPKPYAHDFLPYKRARLPKWVRKLDASREARVRRHSNAPIGRWKGQGPNATPIAEIEKKKETQLKRQSEGGTKIIKNHGSVGSGRVNGGKSKAKEEYF